MEDTILNTIFNINDIAVLFGNDKNYFETLDIWFNNSLFLSCKYILRNIFQFIIINNHIYI